MLLACTMPTVDFEYFLVERSATMSGINTVSGQVTDAAGIRNVEQSVAGSSQADGNILAFPYTTCLFLMLNVSSAFYEYTWFNTSFCFSSVSCAWSRALSPTQRVKPGQFYVFSLEAALRLALDVSSQVCLIFNVYRYVSYLTT